MWVSLWGKGISELKEFPFIFKFCVSQLMTTSKAHSHGKHYCPTIISETRYADILTRNRGWKERVPLILRGLVMRSSSTFAFYPVCWPGFLLDSDWYNVSRTVSYGPVVSPTPSDNRTLHNIARMTLHLPHTLLSILGPSFAPAHSHATLACHVTLTVSLVRPRFTNGSIMGYVSLFGAYLSKGRSGSARKWAELLRMVDLNAKHIRVMWNVGHCQRLRNHTTRQQRPCYSASDLEEEGQPRKGYDHTVHQGRPRHQGRSRQTR